MGDYDLPNLKYARDHEKLAERLGKVLPEHTIELELMSGNYSYAPFVACYVEYPEPLGEGIEKDLNQPLSASSLTQKLGDEPHAYEYVEPSGFKEKPPTLELACDLEGCAILGGEYIGSSRDIRRLTTGKY